MANKITKLKRIKINKFRGLKDIEFDLGNRITVICGKNGTSKSTILGVIAQVFSFRKDYSKPQSGLLSKHKTLTDTRFESNFSDHFRFSEKFDTPGSMDIEFTVYDGSFDCMLDELTLKLYDTQGRKKARPIVRGNKSTGNTNTSRNVTHPVIYLSLARLLPITLRSDYKIRDVEYLKVNAAEFTSLNNKILVKANSNLITATSGTVNSVVVHSNKYDQDSVSVGEDNVGQILQSILSFKRLKEEYPDYHGGILLIDEADAGLFPAAQVEFINLLSRITKSYNIQVVLTSHSPTMIEEIYKLSKKEPRDYKTIYLTDTYGQIQALKQISWREIYADLKVETIKVEDDYLPKVNVYFEDTQGYDFYKALITENNIRKITNNLNNINMSCSDLINLVKRKVPEFCSNSLIILDADVQEDKNYKDISAAKNVCLLPTHLPPDQLLFEFLYNLPPNDNYWKNGYGFTKAVFLRKSSPIIEMLKVVANEGEKIDLMNFIRKYKENEVDYLGKIRQAFKNFAKEDSIVTVVEGKVSSNPYRYWAKCNPHKAEVFKEKFIEALSSVLVKGYGIEMALITNKFKA
ncbi:ATP-dependent nuclease [Yersinia enterocolitica]|uniref:ATP-dependent nuclease n=3 Tax=Yersinia TaxID=629 RepID=UPI001C60D30D|nr:AAA family ATPase [Yersinia enterocolitica]MBW5873623.1 AAA family ATPase [Yersinia enterocolitica]